MFKLLFVICAAIWARGHSLDLAPVIMHCPLFSQKEEVFHAVIFDSFVAPSSQLQGCLAAGGDVSLDAFSLATDEFAGTDTLIVGGNLTFTSGTLSGNVVVGGKADISSALLTGMDGTVRVDSNRYDFAGARIYFENLAWYLADHPNKIDTDGLKEPGVLGVNEVETADDNLHVYNMSCAELKIRHDLGINNVDPDVLFVVNVGGDEDCEMSQVGFQFSGISDNIVFNFYEATQLRVSQVQVPGSILAPFADIIATGGEINGQVVARSWSGTTTIKGEFLRPCSNNGDDGPNGSSLALLQLEKVTARIADNGVGKKYLKRHRAQKHS